MATSKEKNIFLDEKKVKELIKELNDRIDLIHEYFTIDNDNALITMSYEYRVYDLTVESTAYFNNGFYSNAAESDDTYSSGLSLNHNIDEFSIFGYDYNYTDGTSYTNRLNFETGGNIRVAINNPNAKFTYNDNEVATEQDMEYLQKQLTNLEYSADGMTFTYEENSDIAYEKDVPSGASPYAVISKVGGMSYTSENLIIADEIEEKIMDGLTYSFKNGIITINGTSTATSARKILIRLKEPLPVGTYTLKNFVSRENAISKDTLSIVKSNQWETIISFAPINQTYQTTTTTELGYYLMYYMPTAQTYNNYKIIPMLVRGSDVPTKFVPYFEGIKNSVVTEINSNGANLLDLSNFNGSKNGISWYTENGRIYFSGTTTAGTFTTNIKIFLPKGTYTLKEFTNTSSFYFYVQETDSGTGGKTLARVSCFTDSYNVNHTTKTFTTDRDWNCICYIYINVKETNVNDMVVSPMLVKGDIEPIEFSEYKNIDIKTLPNAVKTLTDYGKGVQGKIGVINYLYSNYIDLINKKYIREVIEVNLWELNWTYGTTENHERFRAYTTSIGAGAINRPVIVSDRFISTNSSNVYNHTIDRGIGIEASNVLTIYDSEFTDVETFVNYLRDNQIKCIYPLETPIEEDISYLLKDVDEFIEVEELGSITFENEYKNDTTSNITYQVKIV